MDLLFLYLSSVHYSSIVVEDETKLESGFRSKSAVSEFGAAVSTIS